MWDSLWVNARFATMATGGSPYGAIEDGALAVADGRIAWIGARAQLPSETAAEVFDLEGAWVTPGLIDCHTHLVFGGDRAAEMEERLTGVSYAEIARRGGGILSTVRATRQAAQVDLLAQADRRLEALRAGGVTTIEIKSGYGLDLETESKMLRVARTLGRRPDIDVVTSFLGLHAVPPPDEIGRAAYVDAASGPMLEALIAEGLIDAVDAFCEGIAFSREEIQHFFEAAKVLGLPLRLHADQLSDGGGAELAARLGALSADHVEYAHELGVRAMAGAGTVAVLLPGAFYVLGEKKRPPVAAFRDAGVPMAVATDANPGSSPLLSPLLALNMACILFRLTPEEALRGMTVHAAQALGLDDRGTLTVGKLADLAVWRIDRPAELAYWIGTSPLERLIKAGRATDRPGAGPGWRA